MIEYKYGYNIFNPIFADKIKIITTNGITKSNDNAVMGKGIALSAALKYPHLPHELGVELQTHGNHCNYFQQYNLITFPTKHDWRQNSSYELIETSLNELLLICLDLNNFNLVMPRLGCSNGNLNWNKVQSLITQNLTHPSFHITIV